MRVKKSKAVEQNDTSSRARALFTPSVPRGRPGATQLHAHYKHPPAFWRRRRGNRREDAKVSLAAWPTVGPADRCNKGLDGRTEGRAGDHGPTGRADCRVQTWTQTGREGGEGRRVPWCTHALHTAATHAKKEGGRKKELKRGERGNALFYALAC